MATVACQGPSGDTGPFHTPADWHVDASKGFDHTGPVCLTQVFSDRVGNQPVPTRPLVAKYGSIQMRRTQMAGHSVFDVRVTGNRLHTVADTARTSTSPSCHCLPPHASATWDPSSKSTRGPPGRSPSERTGTCTTEVHADYDGRLLQRKTGSTYTMTVPAGGYWISNTPGCTVSVT